MSVDEWVARANQAPSTPFGGGSGGGGFGGGGGSSSSKPDPWVYYGATGRRERVEVRPAKTQQRKRAGGQSMRVEGDSTPNRRRAETAPIGTVLDIQERPMSEAQGQVMEWYGTPEFNKWGDYLLGLGLIDEQDTRSVETLDEVWQDAIGLSARLWQAGKRVSPWQAARLLAETGGNSGGRGRSGGGGSRYGTARERGFTGARTHTARKKDVDLTDPLTAKAIVNDALSQYLGRSANDEELAAFTQSINAAERANPLETVTTTTSQYDDGIEVSASQSSTTSGGLTGAARQQLVADEAMAKPEYGAYQAASTYFNALLASIGGIGGN